MGVPYVATRCNPALTVQGPLDLEPSSINAHPRPEEGNNAFLTLSLLEHNDHHGYELSKLIESRSGGVVRIHAASLYPLLYRLEKRGLIAGRWVEKAGERRRRYYRITEAGRKQLEAQRRSWLEFAEAIGRITGVEYA
ncbi:MAG: PadR family transcriptional regulator [Gemmatimonas sp.]|nr:PadR family transcriptional regulator [Gemmatimonas sp.]